MALQIEHSGVVERLERCSVYVKITSESACASCKTRGACGMAESQEKIVAVPTPEASSYAPGDVVMVAIRQGAAGVAVFYAYVLPLVVLLSVLVVLIAGLGWGEGRSLLMTLLALGIYFFGLWLFRKKLETKIKFTITKI